MDTINMENVISSKFIDSEFYFLCKDFLFTIESQKYFSFKRKYADTVDWWPKDKIKELKIVSKILKLILYNCNDNFFNSQLENLKQKLEPFIFENLCKNNTILECPICFDESDIFISCFICKNKTCLKCDDYITLCPFCRTIKNKTTNEYQKRIFFNRVTYIFSSNKTLQSSFHKLWASLNF